MDKPEARVRLLEQLIPITTRLGLNQPETIISIAKELEVYVYSEAVTKMAQSAPTTSNPASQKRTRRVRNKITGELE